MTDSTPELLSGDSVQVARRLLGCTLIHESDQGRTSGIIVETEAYNALDPASHSYRGQTERNRVMFGPPGYTYIYFTYGMHYCMNVVTGPVGDAQAVLLRALQPIEGVELMYERRFASHINQPKRNLCNGPGKLVQAMGITKADYGTYLFAGGRLRMEPGKPVKQIVTTTRVGIRQAVEQPWRFYIAGNQFVSKPWLPQV